MFCSRLFPLRHSPFFAVFLAATVLTGCQFQIIVDEAVIPDSAVSESGSSLATALSFTTLSPEDVTSGYCSPAFTVQLVDGSGNPIAATEDLLVSLSDGGAGGTFYVDSSCTSSSSTVTISDGSSSITVYYLNNTDATASFSASASGFSSAGQTVSIGTPFSGGSVSARVGSGSDFNCALVSGEVQCWGDNKFGQLGNASNTDSDTPVKVSTLTGVVQVAAGQDHACARLSGGSVHCWGKNTDGQLGDSTNSNSNVPVQVSGLANATSISAGGRHTCAALSDGTAWCWGANGSGRLGDGTTTTSWVPVQVSGLTGVVQVAAGNIHSCAVTNSGAAVCWGSSSDGQLGDGTSGGSSSTFVQVSGLTSGVASVATGVNSSCAVLNDGSARCWGNNSYYDLGNGNNTDSNLPAQVSGLLSGVLQIASGGYRACAVMASGGAKCWGYNYNGMLGDGSSTRRSEPVDVLGLSTNAIEIATGTTGCAFLSDSTVQCWGPNQEGALGNTAVPLSRYLAPAQVSSLSLPVISADAGTRHTCAVLNDGSAYCWGYNYYGQVGNGSTSGATAGVNLPSLVSGLGSGVASISAGESHSCAAMSDGTARCWGRNASGQLGDNSILDSTVPVTVSGLSGVTAISAGYDHTCALKSDQTVWCWGDGPLGDGTASSSLVPVQASALTLGAVKLSSAWGRTCVVLTDDSAWCWGSDTNGGLGDGGASVSSDAPVQVSGIDGIAAGAAMISSWSHGCATLLDGSARCWGSNSVGQLGDGTTTTRTAPVAVSGLTSGVMSIFAKGSHSCAVINDGTARCWGYNYYGQLGEGSQTSSTLPVSVSGLPGAVDSMIGGKDHTCAIHSDATLSCWGSNGRGQAGIGDPFSTTAVSVAPFAP